MARDKHILSQREIGKLIDRIQNLSMQFQPEGESADDFEKLPEQHQRILRITIPIVVDALAVVCAEIKGRTRLSRTELADILQRAGNAKYEQYEKTTAIGQRFQDNITSVENDKEQRGIKEAFALDFAGAVKAMLFTFDDVAMLSRMRRS